VIIGSIPAFLAGWLFRDSISGSFHELRMVGMLFLFTSFLLLAAQIKIWKNKDITGNINYVSALIIGIFQAGALLPGISRSGSTIAAGLLSGIRKDTAFRFSFYLAIPAVSGAMLYELIRNGFSFPSDIDPAIMAAGMLAAFIFGLGSLRLLRYMIRAKTLYIFSIYTFLLGMSLLTLITG
jgi:undecaprenyl-diphosphatase